jgi:hypothetical protein
MAVTGRFLPVADQRGGNPLAPRSTFESRCINEDLPDFSFNAAEQEGYFTFRGDCWAAGATLPQKSL